MQDQESQNVPAPASDAAQTSVSSDVRREELNEAVRHNIKKGWRVESQTDFTATIAKGKRPNHILHLILTVITGGLWGIFVWLPLSIFKHVDRRLLEVDANGRVTG